MFSGETIWIIGASSGIGEALAHELAAHGARLVLTARRADALAALNASLGSRHVELPLDVADAAAMQRAARQLHEAGRVDRIVFLAALYDPMPLAALDLEKTRQIVAVNLMGAFYCVEACLPLLVAQGSGQLALCGSVAGYIGLPDGQPYSATKAAVRNLAESLRAEAPRGVDIKLISPGFVRTPLTAKNDFAMPMMIEPQAAARAIARGLKSSAFEIHFPKRFTYAMKILAALPYRLSVPLLRSIAR